METTDYLIVGAGFGQARLSPVGWPRPGPNVLILEVGF